MNITINRTKQGWRSMVALMIVSVVALQFVMPVLAATVTDTVVVTQVVTPGITISSPSDITMTPLSITQNTAVGFATWTVTTNNALGYALTLNASTNPALQGSGGRMFTDYATSSPSTWSVTSAYKFGFSVRGTDVNTTTFGTDTDCINTTDVPSATLKWRGFYGTNPITVATTTVPTTTTGSATTMCVATEQNGTFAPSDTYTATITATAATN